MKLHFKSIACGVALITLLSCGRNEAQQPAPYRELVRLQASDAAPGDNFGYHLSLAADGQTLAIGAYARDGARGENVGAVYVFAQSDGKWVEQACLVGDNATEQSLFGLAVGISADGNTLVAGSPDESSAAGDAAGAAYVFVRSDRKWTQQARLQPSDAAAAARAGNVSISRDGNTIAVGAPPANTERKPTAGAVYIFVRDGGGWRQQARLEASDAETGANFGVSVSLSGDGNALAVSASSATNSAGQQAGNVYVFGRAGANWTEEARLQASDAAAGSNFGTRVAISADGDTLGTGAYHARNSAGAAYVFVRSGKTWTEQARLQPSDVVPGDSFGTSPSLSADGNTFAVGTKQTNIAGVIDAGSAYIFVRTDAVWKELVKLHASDPGTYDYFGLRVDLSGDANTLAVSAFGDNNSGGVDAGSVYIFTRAPSN